jgi:amidohydrolase
MSCPISIDDIKAIEQDIIHYRRSIHMHPETGFEEFKTSEMVADLLEEFGLEIIKGIGKTGVIGVLNGRENGKTIALRADMDALNIQEEVETEYKSKVDGKMHACGHDAHTAMLLGAAKVLSTKREHIKGTVKFVFQPAEEGPAPGGGSLIMESGHLDDIDAVFAIHVHPLYETGQIGINKKEAMASTDFFEIDLIGKGSHAAAPHTSIDPIMMAAQTLYAFQNIISRETDPVEPAVLSVCTIHGGNQPNAIPEKVTMTGTIRTLSEETRERIFKRMEEIVKHVSGMNNGSYEIERGRGYPALANHEKMVNFVVGVSQKILGEENVILLDKPTMGGEDFAYYLEKIPGAIFWLGCGNKEKGLTEMLHNSHFVVDEDALILGTAIHVNLALCFLNESRHL